MCRPFGKDGGLREGLRLYKKERGNEKETTLARLGLTRELKKRTCIARKPWNLCLLRFFIEREDKGSCFCLFLYLNSARLDRVGSCNLLKQGGEGS